MKTLTKQNPLPPQGCPPCIVGWLGAAVFGITATQKELRPQTSGSIPIDADPAIAVEWNEINVWRSDSESEVRDSIASLSEYKTGLLTRMGGKIDEFFTGNPKESISMLRMPGSDAATGCAPYLPADFRPEGKLKAAHSLGVATPWAFGHKLFGMRIDITTRPYQSLGGFHYSIRGSVALIWIKVEGILGGCTFPGINSMIANLTRQEVRRGTLTLCLSLRRRRRLRPLRAHSMDHRRFRRSRIGCLCTAILGGALEAGHAKGREGGVCKDIDDFIEPNLQVSPWGGNGAGARRWLGQQ